MIHGPINPAGRPVSDAGEHCRWSGITAGSLIAVLILHQTNNYNSDSFQFIWNIYANNDVVVPTGGCDVSARDVTVTLPDYPGSMAVPLTVHCAQSQQLGYYLSGTTADSANAIFTNTASASPAQGIGVQLTRNGSAVPANSTVSLGTVGTSPVNLGLIYHLCPDHRPLPPATCSRSSASPLSINDDRLYPLALLAGRPRVEPADAERREAAR